MAAVVDGSVADATAQIAARVSDAQPNVTVVVGGARFRVCIYRVYLADPPAVEQPADRVLPMRRTGWGGFVESGTHFLGGVGRCTSIEEAAGKALVLIERETRS